MGEKAPFGNRLGSYPYALLRPETESNCLTRSPHAQGLVRPVQLRTWSNYLLVTTPNPSNRPNRRTLHPAELSSPTVGSAGWAQSTSWSSWPSLSELIQLDQSSSSPSSSSSFHSSLARSSSFHHFSPFLWLSLAHYMIDFHRFLHFVLLLAPKIYYKDFDSKS